MYINDYTNQWAYWFGTAAIQHTTFNSGLNTKTGNGCIIGSRGSVTNPSNWSSSYASAFRSALSSANGGSITAPALAALNAAGNPSTYFPMIKLKSKLGGNDIYIKIPISFIPRDAAETVETGGSMSFELIYNRFQNTDTSRLITNYGYTDPQVAYNIPFNTTINGLYVEAGGYGFSDCLVTIDDISYKCLIDNDNGNLGLRFDITFTITDGVDTYTDTMTPYYIYFALGSAAYAYGFEEQEGGLYPVPTSNIPLVDLLNAHGTNFNHNIDIYDETRQDVNNMFLVNYVGTLAYTFVRFEEPGGTIKCATSLQFTHFITRSFTDNSTPRVYRVVRRRVVNVDVIEYDFVIDYLKDYWQHFGTTSDSVPMVLRSTDPNDYNKHLDDALIPYNGTFTAETYNSVSQVRVCIVLAYPDTADTGRESGTLAFSMPLSTYADFLNWWRTDQTIQNNMGAFYSYVLDVYLIPYSAVNDVYMGTVNSISFVNGSDTATFTGSGMERVNTAQVNNSSISNYVQGSVICTGLDMADCRYFNSHPTVHIPCYGDVTLPREAMEYLDANNILTYRNIINVSDGSIAVSFEPYTEVLDAIALPRVPLPENNQVQALRNVERSRQTAYENAAAGLGMAALTANPMAAIGSATSVITSTHSFDRQAAAVQESTGQISFKTTGLISTYQQNALRFNIPDTSITLFDFYDLNGYPCQKLWTSAVAGYRYWLELQGSLKGTEEYIAGVRSAIDGRGIVYNYY